MICLNIKCDVFEQFENKKRKFCIMAIFKNEHSYMEEWLDYHIGQGIDHFYLYCNDKDLDKYPYLHKYNSKITIIPWGEKKNNGINTIQRQAYAHCVRNYYREFQFIMMLDLDEFLASLEEATRVIDIVNRLDPKKTKALKIMRFDYGSSGHTTRPDGNVMDNYTKHEKLCSSYKAIANIDHINRLQNFYGVHDFPYNKDDGMIYNKFFSYERTGYPSGCEEDTPTEIPLIIKHYYTKSRKEYLERCKLWEKGGVNIFGYRQNCEEVFSEKDKKRNQVSRYEYLRRTYP